MTLFSGPVIWKDEHMEKVVAYSDRNINIQEPAGDNLEEDTDRLPLIDRIEEALILSRFYFELETWAESHTACKEKDHQGREEKWARHAGDTGSSDAESKCVPPTLENLEKSVLVDWNA